MSAGFSVKNHSGPDRGWVEDTRERGFSAGATKPFLCCSESGSWESLFFSFLLLPSGFLLCGDKMSWSSPHVLHLQRALAFQDSCAYSLPCCLFFPIRKAVVDPHLSLSGITNSWFSPCEKHACIQRKEKAGSPWRALCMIVFLPQLCFWTALPVFCYRIVLQEPIISAKIPQVGVPVWPANQSDCGLQWKNWIILTIPAPR